MATITISASALKYVMPPTSSSWKDRCYQGQYSGSSQKSGAMLFAKLRDGTVNWSNQRIISVALSCTYDGAGSNSEKTLGLYIGTQNAITGTGAAMRGTLVGNIPTNGKAYNAARTIYFNSETNAAAFAVLADWLVHGTTNTLATWRNETDGGHSYSSNYLAIKAATMLIEYEAAGSYGDLSDDDVELGETVTLNISPVDTEGTLTHTVRFKAGSKSYTAMTKGSSLTVSYTIPIDWHDQITGMEGDATCELVTYRNGSEVATSVIPFKIRIPSSWAITLNAFSAKRYSSHLDDQGHTVYEDDLLGNHVWISYSVSASYISTAPTAPKPSIKIVYTRADDVSITGQITRQISNATTEVNNDRTAFSGAFSISYEYNFVAIVSNGHQSVQMLATVSNGSPLIHITRDGVSIGGFSHGTELLQLFESVFPALLYNGAAVNGAFYDVSGTEWIYPTPASGVTTPADSNFGDGALRYKRIGSLIIIAGGVTVAGGNDIAQLPYAPASGQHYILAPCSGYNVARLFVNPSGLLKCEWIRKLSDGSAYTGAIWVDCAMAFWIS